MASEVIMPALGMAQETGKIVAWLKPEGTSVSEGEPIMEIETDKATVEIESPASGVLSRVSAEGEDIPVGQTVAWILAPGETAPRQDSQEENEGVLEPSQERQVAISPVARRMAEQHGVDLNAIKPDGGRITKTAIQAIIGGRTGGGQPPRLLPASPKARRLAAENGLSIGSLAGSGPGGAVLAEDVLQAGRASTTGTAALAQPGLSTVWKLMAERVTQSWTSVPHFYLLREVNASRLVAWRERLISRNPDRHITFTDLFVRVVAAALQKHPEINSRWEAGEIRRNEGIHIGLAVAVDDGLIVPVLRDAGDLKVSEISERRESLLQKARSRKLRPEDFAEGTFTISNLGMFGVDAFNAIINAPQAAILAVGRIADRVVPLNGQPAIQPMMILSLSCDHRIVDGARAAQFLQTLVAMLEEPLELFE